jgi:hypothetical protein
MNQMIDLDNLGREIDKQPGPLHRAYTSPLRHSDIRKGLVELDHLVTDNDQLRTERDSYKTDKELLEREVETLKAIHKADRAALTQDISRLRSARDYYLRAFTELRATLEGFTAYLETGAKMQLDFHQRGAMLLKDAMSQAQARAFGERAPAVPQQPQDDPAIPLPSIVAQGPAPAA